MNHFCFVLLNFSDDKRANVSHNKTSGHVENCRKYFKSLMID